MVESDVDGVLAQGTKMSGTLQFDRVVRIDGQFEGKVESKGKLILGSSAEVEADLDVGELEVEGKLKGKVRASQRVLIRAGGEVEADVVTGKLAVEDGAFFRGHCDMTERAANAAAAAGGPLDSKRPAAAGGSAGSSATPPGGASPVPQRST